MSSVRGPYRVLADQAHARRTQSTTIAELQLIAKEAKALCERALTVDEHALGARLLDAARWAVNRAKMMEEQ